MCYATEPLFSLDIANLSWSGRSHMSARALYQWRAEGKGWLAHDVINTVTTHGVTDTDCQTQKDRAEGCVSGSFKRWFERREENKRKKKKKEKKARNLMKNCRKCFRSFVVVVVVCSPLKSNCHYRQKQKEVGSHRYMYQQHRCHCC